VHAGISPDELRRKAAEDERAEPFIHPECGCSTAALWQAGEGDLPRARVLSTGGMLDAARTTTAVRVLAATETGLLHQLRRANRPCAPSRSTRTSAAQDPGAIRQAPRHWP